MKYFLFEFQSKFPDGEPKVEEANSYVVSMLAARYTKCTKVYLVHNQDIKAPGVESELMELKKQDSSRIKIVPVSTKFHCKFIASENPDGTATILLTSANFTTQHINEYLDVNLEWVSPWYTLAAKRWAIIKRQIGYK